VIAQMHGCRSIAVDLPGFGLSDSYSYAGRSLRRHATAQLASVLDACGLDRAVLVGTSLGAMWALCLAADAPDRVPAVVSIGMPAVALPGIHRDPFFTLLTIPGLGRVASRLLPSPTSAKAVRRSMKRVIGQAALDRTPLEFWELVAAIGRMPGWHDAMWTHLNLALRFGRERAENNLSDDELRSIATPVCFIWGQDDAYGGPQIGRRATELMPRARLEVMSGNHAPFLDHPERCAALIMHAVEGAQAADPSADHLGGS
jgi:pimeloyl-ACP methyl ester carboxylesterase